MNLNEQHIQVGIVDYGMGNIQSVVNAFERLDVKATLVRTPDELRSARLLVLPGVGAFGKAMENLQRQRLVDPIRDLVLQERRPLLGICLGMQLLADESEERGRYKGLALIPGSVKQIPTPGDLRLPHVGWNTVQVEQPEPLFSEIRSGDTFYFVHSYRFECEPKHCALLSNYGENLCAAVQDRNIYGVQFHPEKSQSNGLKVLGAFVNRHLTTPLQSC